MAHGGSQARGQIGAVAASLHHSQRTQDLSHLCNLHHSSRQCWILNPLREARDQTHNLMFPSQIHFHCATTGTPTLFILLFTAALWHMEVHKLGVKLEL